MPAVVIVGAQWGDEGKGKATDLLGERVDYVVKPNGGNNAGHTVVVDGEKFELKLLPAGILSPRVTPVIGNGVVVNLEALFEEIDGLEARGADTSKLRVSANAHLVALDHFFTHLGLGPANVGRDEPELVPDILFGAAVCLALDDAVAEHIMTAWQAGRSSLRAA